MGVVHVVNVSRALMVDLVHGPDGFGVAFVEVGFFDFVPQFVFEGFDYGFDFVVARRWRFV